MWLVTMLQLFIGWYVMTDSSNVISFGTRFGEKKIGASSKILPCLVTVDVVDASDYVGNNLGIVSYTGIPFSDYKRKLRFSIAARSANEVGPTTTGCRMHLCYQMI